MFKARSKKALALALAVLTVVLLAACSSSSSSTTTFSTSKTDADGNTTTKTVTTEVGVSAGADGVKTTNQTTTETTTTAADETESWDELAEHMYATYDIGAEGSNEDGDMFYYAFSEYDDEVAALVIVSADGTQFQGREGVLLYKEDHVVLYSEKMDDSTPFFFSEVDDNGDFTMTFVLDGDVAAMHLVDQDTIISDIIARLQEFE